MTLARPLLRRAGALAVAALLAGAAVAVAVWLLGAGAQARELLELDFVGPDPALAVALNTAATNLRLAAAVLLAAYARSRWPWLRPAVDPLMLLLLAVNCLLLGVAAGGYGHRLLATLALHGPPELAGFALAGAAYLAARAQQLTLPNLCATAAGAAALLLAAAWVETYVSLGGTR